VTGRNPRFETYFSKLRQWREELNALREIMLECDLSEELKWRQPCYTFDGANIVILSCFKSHCALGFFKGSLMPDPDNKLALPGPNSKAARMLRFTNLDEIRADRDLIKRYVASAIEVEASGQKVDFSANKSVTMLDELANALAKNKALKTAWDALTPGRKRGWVLHFDSAKQSATKASRIEKAAPKILKGLGIHDEAKAKTKKPKSGLLDHQNWNGHDPQRQG
jgi:uncharacterized protein YdeI (YjbR/CyaY-like superfamily)